MSDSVAKMQKTLLDDAKKASATAYAPYSHFNVGAAVRTKSGNVYTGSNIENASYSLSICAERVAIFKAVSSGDLEITDLAVFSNAEKPSRPCGACRQVLSEFAKAATIICGNKDATEVTSIQKLFPEPFKIETG